MAIVKALSGVVQSASALTLLVGPVVEQTTLKPAMEAAQSDGEKQVAKSNIRTYSHVAHAGLAGIAVGNFLHRALDKNRRTGTPAYKKWARRGDLLVLGIIAAGGATRVYTKKLKTLEPGSPAAQAAEKKLSLISKLTPVLSLLVLFTNSRKHKNKNTAQK